MHPRRGPADGSRLAVISRKAIPADVRSVVLHEAAYMCGNPRCRTPLTLEIHHLEPVSNDGGNEPANLLCLCPNCHTRHHQGLIPIESLRSWKHLLLTLNAAYDRGSVDTLLVLGQVDKLAITADALLQRAGLLASGLIEIATHAHGLASGFGADVLSIRLSTKGRAFVDAWLNGNEAEAFASIAG